MTKKHGGLRDGAGRPPGSKNRATVEQKANLSELARELTDVALVALAEVAANGVSESARVSAAVAILDRAYGRPRQSVEVKTVGETWIGEVIRQINERGSPPPICFKDAG